MGTFRTIFKLKIPMISVLVVSLFLGVLFLTSMSPPPLYALSVPLTIQEALPSGVNGVARSAAPVTVGVPLAEEAGIKGIAQLGLSGVTAGQFRPLAWWPNGNIRWVLVDFQSDLDAGAVKSSVTLTDGTGNFGGANLASDAGATIRVNTGAAQFVLRKTNCNIFDSVSISGLQVVASGNAGRISVVGNDGTIYTSTNDAASTATIEENGPVRAVTKSTGTLKSAAGTRILDYTMRLHFYSGKSYVRAELILRNASKIDARPVLFQSAEAVVPLVLGASKTVNFSRKVDVVASALPAGASAYLFQGYNASRVIPYGTNCYSWDPPGPGTCSSTVYTYDPAFQGLSIQVGNQSVNPLGNMQDWTQGYAGVADNTGKTVNVAMRWMSANFPAGFEFNDNGETSIELYSKRNTKTLKLQFGKHDMRELLWDFSAQPKDGKESLYNLQYPVIARAPFDYYRGTRALFGQAELVAEAEQQSVFSKVGKISPSLANPALYSYYRNWWWSETGGNNQTDFPLNDLFDFYRTGNPGFYANGEQRTQFNYVSATPFSDDYTTESVTTGTDPLSSSSGISGGFIDAEHSNVGSTPFYYYISGAESARESYLEYGENLYREQVKGYFPLPSTTYLRAWSRKLRNMALIYEFSCQTGSCVPAYKVLLETAVNSFLDLRDSPLQGTNYYSTPHGRNLDRGYLWWDTTLGSGKRVVHSFFHSQIHFEAMWQLRRVMQDTQWTYPRSQDLDDYLSGFAHFIFDEFLAEMPANEPHGWKYGFQYDYLIDETNSTTGLVPYSAERPAIWLYQQTGNGAYLDKAAELLWETATYATNRNPSELQEQAFMWSYLNKSLLPVWHDLAVSAVDNGGGTYTLSWTVPAGAEKFQIKYSDKPIVEWLGFNQASRTYQYNPAQYTPFFAAANIASNPVPVSAGTRQSVTLTGLPAGVSFAMKYLSGSSSRGLSAPAAPKGLKGQRL